MTALASMETAAAVDESANIALVNRCQTNDPEACNELLSRFNAKILSTAYRILGEESSAEDALQETLLNVYRGLGSFRGESKIATWITKVTINVCLGMLRRDRKRRQLVNLTDELKQGLPADRTAYIDPLEHASQAELRDMVREALSRMTRKQSIVVRMHDMEGHTIRDIARITRCPLGTVKSRLFYGRQEFRTIFTSFLNERRRSLILPRYAGLNDCQRGHVAAEVRQVQQRVAGECGADDCRG